jgi:NADH-quinone oxidoreductase subunit N
MSEISHFNLDLFIDKLCVINLLIEKYDSILLFLILNFKDFEIGSLIFDMYSFKNLDDNSGIIFLISILEMSNTYLFNLFTLEECFNLELIKFALLFILISLFFKLAVAPFHVWSPDVYENSPSASTFFFSVVPKLSIFILMLRIFYYSFFSFFSSWKIILILVISLTVLIGSFGGIEQRKLKSLLVYSSISHMGYSLIAFGSGTFDNLQTLFSYLIIYSFSGLCIWSVFILTRVKSSHFKKQNKDLTDLVSFSKSNYTLATFFSVALFSVAGFPPMIGFLVKINVFLTAIESSMYFISLISILCSVVATFYYIRIIKIIFFEKTVAGKLYYPISSERVYILSGLLWFMIILFINPTLLFLFSYKFSLLF